MKPNQVKALLLNSVGKQTEFQIIEGPLHGVLGVLLFDSAREVRKVGAFVEFRIIVENKLGRAAVVYFVRPQNTFERNSEGPLNIKDGYITFRGFISEFKTDNSPVKAEKHRILKDGTAVDITFNDETGDGVLRLPGTYTPEEKTKKPSKSSKLTEKKDR